MGTLNFFGGEKGGVGKSFCNKTLLTYLIDHEIPFVAFDTDRSNPDVKRCMDSVCTVKLAILSEAVRLEDAAHDIFNTAIEHDVYVNLPAQVVPALHRWITNNSLFELAVDCGVKMRLFHISDAGFDSLQLFERSLQLFGGHIPHVLVQNLGMTEDWSPVEKDTDIQKLIVDYDVIVMNLPRFIGNADRNFIDRHSLSFREALEHPDLGPISRQRVKTFLRSAYAEFDRVGLFKTPSDVQTIARKSIRQGGKRHG